MRVAIAALGSRGDVLPYVVLGRGLVDAGHDVLVSTMGRFRGLVEGAGLGFHELPGDPVDLFRAGRIDVSPRRPLHQLKLVHMAVDALVRQTDPEQLVDAWADRDFIVATTGSPFAIATAERLGARCAGVVMTPAVPTGAFAQPVLVPRLALGRSGNLASWLFASRLAKNYREPLRPAARRAMRLPVFPLAADRAGAAWPPVPVLHAYSPEVVPRPSDWPGHVAVTGWLLPELSSGPLPAPVERFIDAGDPPIYIGFGSMPVPHFDGIARMLVAALGRSGQRAIVSGAALGRAAALQGSDAVLTADELPHERLFDRVRAVVHHGGSGTVGAGLRAGRPTLVTPFIFDQFFWGERVRRIGAGPAPIPFRWLSEDRLARALAELASGRYDSVAQRIGERIRAEDSATRAVEEIERLSGSR
jgi:sterol 3beta-glucosyltransferase